MEQKAHARTEVSDEDAISSGCALMIELALSGDPPSGPPALAVAGRFETVVAMDMREVTPRFPCPRGA
jgi:hypothetical protein